MRDTLKYIGRWIIRFILISIIYATMQSCSKAVTYDDVKEYVEATADYFPNNSTYQQLKSNVNLTSVQNGLNAMNIANYNNFLVYSQQKTRGYDIYYYFFNATNWDASTQSLTFAGQYISGLYETQWNSWSGSNTINNNSINNILASGTYFSRTENDYNNLRAMMYTLQTFEATPITFVGMQAVNTNPMSFTHMFSEEVTINGNTYQANELNYNYRIEFIESIIGFEGYTSLVANLDTISLEVQDLRRLCNVKMQ